MRGLLSIVGSIAIVALIVIATRWVSGPKGSPLPKTRDGANVYEVKRQWRALGTVGGVFWLMCIHLVMAGPTFLPRRGANSNYGCVRRNGDLARSRFGNHRSKRHHEEVVMVFALFSMEANHGNSTAQ